MIEWMQKHKKWLVITIWISTIAFVGAGFVGWGSYNFGRTNSTIMSVGSEDISIKEVQQEYGKLFEQYKKIFGEQFNKQLAEQIKLDQIALNEVMKRYFLIELAKQYGFYATNEEVAKVIVSNQAFYKDGKFDKNLYKKILKENRIDINDFENSIKKDIMIQKLLGSFEFTPLPNELDNIKKYIFAKDKIAYKVINLNDIKPSYTTKDINDFYEKHKQNYKSNKIYICKIKEVDGDKKSALKTYLNLKKNKISFDKTIDIDEFNNSFNKEDFDKIKLAKLNKVLKPIKVDNKYLILKLVKIEEPKILPLKKVKSLVERDLINQLKSQIANNKKDSLIKDFSSNDVVVLDKEKPIKIKGLTKEEVNRLSLFVANSLSLVDSADLGDKIVVFKLLDTIVSNPKIPKIEVALLDSIKNIKQDEIFSNLIDKLSKKIEVVRYYK